MKELLFKLLFPSINLEMWTQKYAIERYKEMVDLYTKNESTYDKMIEDLNVRCAVYKDKPEKLRDTNLKCKNDNEENN